MFEKYDQKARRAIFFARYEASGFGALCIESEHLLLGVVREGKALNSLLGLGVGAIRVQIEGATAPMAKTSTSVDMPLSEECKRILAFSAEESTRLNNSYIGVEHLFLGILREQQCLAARLLHGRGFELNQARKTIADAGQELTQVSGSGGWMGSGSGTLRMPSSRVVDIVDSETAETLLSYADKFDVPRIGESIVLQSGSQLAESYRVTDVRWEIERETKPARLNAIRVLVVKQN